MFFVCLPEGSSFYPKNSRFQVSTMKKGGVGAGNLWVPVLDDGICFQGHTFFLKHRKTPVFLQSVAEINPFIENIGTAKKNLDLPSGKRFHNYGKSPFLMGKSTINGHFQ